MINLASQAKNVSALIAATQDGSAAKAASSPLKELGAEVITSLGKLKLDAPYAIKSFLSVSHPYSSDLKQKAAKLGKSLGL